MVIVTRWYGGVHMGPNRFTCIAKTAEEAAKLLASLAASNDQADLCVFNS